jgi:hypothetical protein
MPKHPQFTPSALHRYSESLRRQLYDAVVAHVWTPTGPGDYVPDYTPDSAGLTVVYLFGRWFVFWVELEEPDTAPNDQRIQVARIIASPDSPFGIQLSEV